ncbi:MAG: DUF423 domain-containing protein [Saprospiraceae bacterium]|nr:DUF423 domain-containing protein [Saprospiraceae bacterium]
MSRFTKNTLLIGSILMGMAVILGAFGAHALADKLSAHQLQSYHTGVQYQFLHSLAILVFGALSFHLPETKLRWPIMLIGMGILLFSGSIYLLSTADLTGIPKGILGPITPIGGILFIAGWFSLAYKLIKTENQ